MARLPDAPYRTARPADNRAQISPQAIEKAILAKAQAAMAERARLREMEVRAMAAQEQEQRAAADTQRKERRQAMEDEAVAYVADLMRLAGLRV